MAIMQPVPRMIRCSIFVNLPGLAPHSHGFLLRYPDTHFSRPLRRSARPSITKDMAITTKSAQVTEQSAGRADRVVHSLTSLSHSKMRGLFDNGCVAVNG